MTAKEFPISFYEQIQAVREGTADRQTHEALEQQLASDPQAREAYYALIDVEQGLVEIASHPVSMIDGGTPSRREVRSAGKRRWIDYGLVAAASLLVGMLLEWWIFGRSADVDPVFRQRIAVAPSAPQYVATLIRSTDCDWDDTAFPFFEGKRLLSRELRLHRGVAEFRMDSGVRLVLEGPTVMKIASGRAATLESGKVVLHGHEMADGFVLSTPKATLVDIGTEYGAVVDEEANVELHVFQGSVLIGPKDATTETLVEAGVAKRIDQTNELKDVPLRPEIFQREVPGRTEQSGVSRDGIMAFDGFRNVSADRLLDGWQSGGSGWDGDWHIPKNRLMAGKGTVDPERQLIWGANATDRTRGALVLTARDNIARRELKHPIRMEADAIYYVSFLMMKLTDAPTGKSQYGSLSFRTTQDSSRSNRLVFGMSSERLPILSHNDQQQRTAPPLQLNTPYLYVAKIVASETGPDQVQMRVFSPEEEIPVSEPHVWTCVTSPVYDDAVYDLLQLYVEGTGYVFDEIRVASSWQAATNFEWPKEKADETLPGKD